MFRTATILCLLAALAAAAEQKTLVFADKTKKTVTLKAFDDDSLTYTRGGKEYRVAWNELTPQSAYDARKALTPYDDGAARIELAEFARERRLYPDALEQLEIGLALGGLDEAAFEKRAHEVQEEEVEHLSASIDTLIKSKAEASLTLAAIKRLKDRYPAHQANHKFEAHIPKLVEQLAEKAEAQQDAQKKATQDKKLLKLRAAVQKENARKLKALAKAEKLHDESAEAIRKRQVSRVKKKLVEPMGAEKYYKRARKHLRKMAVIDKHFKIVTKDGLQKEYEQIEQKLIDCYLQVARILLKERNYKGTIPYVRKILLYDPIHEEALEMVEEIRENRIHFKLSDITNARPRVTGG